MKNFLVEKQQYRIWTETSLDQLVVGDVFRICNYLNHLNEYVVCRDRCGCSDYTVTGGSYIHPIYGLRVIPVKSTVPNDKIKFIGEGYIIIEDKR